MLAVDGGQDPVEERCVLFETEDAQAADDARDSQVVVVEAFDPVLGCLVEVAAESDFEPWVAVLRPGWFEPVEVQHAG